MDRVQKFIDSLEYNSTFFGVLAAIIAVIITIVIFWILRRKGASRQNILITGLSESGKTLLFSRLVSTKRVETYTSMKENSAFINIPKKKSVNLVDVPGNERLRSHYLDKYLPSARGVIFVLDSSNFQQTLRDVAGYLFMLLQMPIIHKWQIPFVIACNKQDHAVSKGSKVIKSLLERELNALRKTQTGRLSETTEGEEKVFLGSPNKDFQFSDLKNISIDFIECSAVEQEGEILKPLWTWLKKVS